MLAADVLGVNLDRTGGHSSIDDARVTMQLWLNHTIGNIPQLATSSAPAPATATTMSAFISATTATNTAASVPDATATTTYYDVSTLYGKPETDEHDTQLSEQLRLKALTTKKQVGLSTIVHRVLGKTIQTDAIGHSGVEDAAYHDGTLAGSCCCCKAAWRKP
jgi:hypothetical protein